MSPDVSRVMKVAARPSIVMVEGRGSWLWDADGKRYLDFVQGWAVNCLGHSPRRHRARRSSAQARRLINASPAFYNEPMAKLATLIAEASGLADVFLCNSGAEANEGAIKLARKWGAQPSRRRLRDHHDGPRVPRPHAGDDVRVGQAGLGRRCSSRRCRASRRCRSATSTRCARAITPTDGGGDARADPGRGRRAHGDRRLPARAAAS